MFMPIQESGNASFQIRQETRTGLLCLSSLWLPTFQVTKLVWWLLVTIFLAWTASNRSRWTAQQERAVVENKNKSKSTQYILLRLMRQVSFFPIQTTYLQAYTSPPCQAYLSSHSDTLCNPELYYYYILHMCLCLF